MKTKQEAPQPRVSKLIPISIDNIDEYVTLVYICSTENCNDDYMEYFLSWVLDGNEAFCASCNCQLELVSAIIEQ